MKLTREECVDALARSATYAEEAKTLLLRLVYERSLSDEDVRTMHRLVGKIEAGVQYARLHD